MEERTRDTDNLQTMEEVGRFEDVLVEKPTAARGGRSRRADEPPSEESTAVEAGSQSDIDVSHRETPPVEEQHVMRGLTIGDLEMMPKMEEIRKLEEIPVGGTTNIEPEVIGAIAGVAARSVEGVASLGTASLRRTMRERFGSAENRSRGVEVEAGKREVILDINIKMIYGYSIPRTVIKIRETVADRLLRLCGLVAKEINIRVTSLEFPARMPARVQ